MELSEAIAKRRSTRAFTDRPVTREEVEILLDAAIHAPSACNMQSWHFYAVMDEGLRAKFTEVCAAWATKAPVIFVVCTDGEAIIGRFGERAKLFTHQDTALAAENLMLKAVELGLGSCIMGAFNAAKCSELLEIPEKYEIVALIPVGEPTEEIPARERKPLSEVAEILDGTTPVEKAHEEMKPFSLRHQSLPGAIFDDLNLSGASFNNINLSGAKFGDINLSNASFGGMTFEGSKFGCVDLRNVTIENADLDGMTVNGFNLLDLIEKNK